MTKMPKVTFVFTHASLIRVWERTKEILAADGVELTVANQMSRVNWECFAAESVETADVLYLDLTRHFGCFDILLDAATAVPLVIPGGLEVQGEWSDIDRPALTAIQSYLKAGRAEDFANGILWLLHRAGLRAELPPPPADPVLFGVYHPASDRIWDTTAPYLDWVDARSPERAGAPVVGIIFDRHGWLNGDTVAVDHCIAHLEAVGLVPLPMFCDWDVGIVLGAPSHPIRRVFDACGARLAAIWNSAIVHGREENTSGGPFASHDVPVFQVLRNWSSSADEWRSSDEGMSPINMAFGLTRPELMGCIDPTIAACAAPPKDGSEERVVEVLDDQMARLAGRTLAWVNLRRKANAEKRIAIMLHNPPCKGLEATIGNAASLDGLDSAVRVLKRLKAEGYTVSDVPENGQALLALILERKAISEFRWTNVEEIVAKGGALTEIDEATYRADFDRLPQAIRDKVDTAWEPFPAKSMVHNPESDAPTLVISGLRFGNVLVMTEPKRGCWGPKCDGEVCRILHEPDVPPPHHWLATYWYLQRNVDALVTMGADGPLEFLPGKRAGLSEDCFPNISLGNLPVIYPYVMNNPGEGMIAKRRGRAVLVDHLSAPVARADSLGKRWDDLDDLHRQFLHVGKTGAARKAELETALRAELLALGLLAEDATEQDFALAVEQLPRRLTVMRRRTLTVGLHTLGLSPDEENAARYLAEAKGTEGKRDINAEAFLASLARCDAEMDAVVHALDGGFVAPGPCGHLSRGKLDVLPTGRNFYAIDLSLLPTKAACVVGARMGEKLLNAYLADEGDFPRTIGITLWSSDAFQADGELASQVLWLMGCRPRYDDSGKVKGVDVVPLSEMTMTLADGSQRLRPRIDVVVQMSSIVRDTLPNIYALFDKAVAAVADLDEPEEMNFIRAHVTARMADLKATLKDVEDAGLKRLARYRCFSSGNGAYGSGISLAIDASAWEDDADLAEVLVNGSGHAYGADGKAANLPTAAVLSEYASLVKRMDVSYQRAATPEGDLLAYGCYVGTQGGAAAAKRGLGGGGMRLYWGDTQATEDGEVRSVKEEISLSLATSLLNTEWFEEAKKQGYIGANSVSGRTNHLFAWSATTHEVDTTQFNAVHDMYVRNQENRDWLKETNVYALEELTRRLLEAEARGLWDADALRLDELKTAVLDLEGDIEERMGPVKGEFQGAAVDIKTQDSVKEWAYEFRAK
ncbi:MAG: cobaltochelatase subunit CobN [Rhodospirillaceae bacterium]|nr:cobaltochelatase subunit CobN [Rhodospirillaceae bacterium]